MVEPSTYDIFRNVVASLSDTGRYLAMATSTSGRLRKMSFTW
jgi:hypothetical protein